MGLRRIIVLLIALIAAGGTAMYARSWVQGQQVTAAPTPAPAPEFHEVLVADMALPAGTFIKPQHLRWQAWPTDDVPASYVLKGERTEEEMVGAVVRRGIALGEPITDGGVVKPDERGFLAAVLNPGMRAVSVPINPTSSNSGLIFPGDRVDMILTQTLVADEGGETRRVSETVLQNLRIIAMGAATGDNPAEGKSHQGARTATFEVTPKQAEEVALLTELGKLSLSLRSLARPETEIIQTADATPQVTWDRDVSQVLSAGRLTSRLLVLRGAKSQGVALEQGGN
jgi:pilus assembly protein CpaB